MEKHIPGTNKAFKDENVFEDYQKMIEVTDGLSLGQVCAISGLDQFIIQNWVKRGYVARPVNKKYYDRHLARILMINSLKDTMKIEEIGKLMELINGDVEDESDDLLSEVELYNLFCKTVYNLDKDRTIEECIKKVMKSVSKNDEKLFTALEVMVYGYIAGEYKKTSKQHLQELESY